MKVGPIAEMSDEFGNHPFGRMHLDGEHCFLCGASLLEAKTDEHIFPRWLQKQFDLWNRKLTLLNNHPITYRSLTIPCCTECNGTYLSRLENHVCNAVESGYEAVKTLNPTIIFLWVAKMVYGIKFKELFLRKNIKDPNGDEKILTAEFLKGSSALHTMLQGVWRDIKFTNHFPFSVLVLNLHMENERQFNFIDLIGLHTVSLRLNNIGIIVSLQDFGWATKTYGNYVSAVNGRKITTIQFDELFAKVTYQSRLIENVPLFQFSVSKDLKSPIEVRILNEPRILEWHQSEFFYCLQAMFEQQQHQESVEFYPPDKVTSWMGSNSSELFLWNADGSKLE